MMRRVDLLPRAYAEKRRQRRTATGIGVVGVVLIVLLIGYWVFLGMQISDAEQDLARVQERNAALQAEIDELQEFAALENEVNTKVAALQTVMVGDIDWPKVMTEIAMVLPAEMWLVEFTGSAAQTEGETPVGTETAPVRINPDAPLGRLQFTGKSLTMPGVAKWLIRQISIEDFRAVFLNSAVFTDQPIGNRNVADFDSTLEFSDEALSNRFQRGLQ